MVKQEKETKVKSQKVEATSTVAKPAKIMSVLRALATTVLFGVTVVIWYWVGIVLFGLSASEGFFKDKSESAYSSEMVVAEVNGSPIKLAEVEQFIAGVPQLQELPLEMVYPQILETVINSKVLLEGAAKAGVEKDAEVIKALKVAKEQILSQAYLKKQVERQMTPENLQKMYLNEIRNFERQDEILARHILVGTQKEAEDILIQLKAGVDFAMLANEKSLDKDNRGGSLGYFTKNMMIPEFGDAVFAMEKGQLSKPIKTPFGWHIVLVEDRRLAAPPAFEEVQDQLKQIYVERYLPTVLAEERQKAGVKVLKPVLR